MTASEMFVLNTSYEGLSHLIIEAMNMNLPVVTTRVGGNVELIENNKTGLLVEYNNKEELVRMIQKLWQEKELAKDLARNAKQNVEKLFNKDVMMDKLIEVLK
jgi:glycosyltransferase involved in cell wall biosynthesis